MTNTSMHKPVTGAEQVIQGAPSVTLDSGDHCIPQHYLSYAYQRDTIEDIVRQCHLSDDYLIMAGEDSGGLYIQIGIVGFDTYKARTPESKRKIVYGRRWRIEPKFPTSELIQTIFLALKKAREHEVRERFKVALNGQWSSPFSTHQDLPLFVAQSSFLRDNEGSPSIHHFRQQAVRICRQLRFDHGNISVLSIEQRSNAQWLLDLSLSPSRYSELPESAMRTMTLLLDSPSVNIMLFALMDMFIKRSDDWVAEHFTYQKVARFSTRYSATRQASLSLQTRKRNEQAEFDDFYQRLAAHNDGVDRDRAPDIIGKHLPRDIQNQLQQHSDIDGFLPELSITAAP
ncbi:hypothetical protein [Alteromonas lipolytica]|uniref:Uncharacterized protein n=1 Tax=Alteromonas lipolytica TaxID=1856405 RepID=A0A1E8F8D0_9ALTE|nr:hypothetical protein [Alteromonas lipolytica]OFI32177.1 hypothetical protein BFC17_08090 [Alteromonas lipolytica]GGF83278.1 hypothetical protein GCM10011338_39490 [Alteromonas lipolytica]